ncbi:SpoIIE family protein phosphatase [Kiritimatiellota bacterium B12222]|nr:SpoIIE family protein phosphatase [Kiritimatiellota bacterium B12222]
MDSFAHLIEDLEKKADEYRTDCDVVDDEIRALFESEIQRALNKLAHALPLRDESALRACAHTLTGTGGVAGAPEISVLGEELRSASIHHDWGRCEQLIHAFEAWHTLRSSPKEITGPTPSPPPEKNKDLPSLQGRILVVDDEQANRCYLESILQKCGATVMVASSGEEALALIQTNPPDVALVDVVMPGMQGYEVCEHIQRTPGMEQISVIMVTAKSTPEDVEMAFSKGAFDYIRKPFHSRELIARVQNALRLKQHTDALELWNHRMTRELEMAGNVQCKLFNSTPIFGASYDYRVCYKPSQLIGGDMFDLLPLSDGKFLAYIADVAGHGAGSALISTLMKGLIQEIISGYPEYTLDEIANELHKRYRNCVEDPELYATLVFIRVDPKNHRGEYLSCGHPPPLLFDQQGQLTSDFDPYLGGMPIGMNPASNQTAYLPQDICTFHLPQNGYLYLYTDGITEARTASGAECELTGLLTGIQHCLQHPTPNYQPTHIIKTLQEQGYDLDVDDCSLMAIRFLAPPLLTCTGEQPATYPGIDQIATLLTQTLSEAGWPYEDTALAQLLIIEHCGNIIKHGNPPPGSTIFYRLVLEPDTAQLVLSDFGYAWDPITRWVEKTETANLYAENGRGLALIHHICTSQQYYRREHKNTFVYQIDKNIPDRLSDQLHQA